MDSWGPGLSALDDPITAERNDIERRDALLDGKRGIKVYIYVLGRWKTSCRLSRRQKKKVQLMTPALNVKW
jgi:hypothetical protein